VTGIADGTRIQVGGAITHRQRPATAITFLNLEDETACSTSSATSASGKDSDT
jgi:hypothetical protein